MRLDSRRMCRKYRFCWPAASPTPISSGPLTSQLAQKAGVDQKVIDAIKYRKGVEGLPEDDVALIQLGREIYQKKKVDSETFAHANKIYGPSKLVNIVGLMGFYSTAAAELEAFGFEMPRDRSPCCRRPAGNQITTRPSRGANRRLAPPSASIISLGSLHRFSLGCPPPILTFESIIVSRSARESFSVLLRHRNNRLVLDSSRNRMITTMASMGWDAYISSPASKL